MNYTSKVAHPQCASLVHHHRHLAVGLGQVRMDVTHALMTFISAEEQHSLDGFDDIVHIRPDTHNYLMTCKEAYIESQCS